MHVHISIYGLPGFFRTTCVNHRFSGLVPSLLPSGRRPGFFFCSFYLRGNRSRRFFFFVVVFFYFFYCFVQPSAGVALRCKRSAEP